MKPVIFLPSFDRSFRKLPAALQEKTTVASGKFFDFLASGQLSPGLGYKKLGGNKYEFRVDIRLRVVIRDDEDAVCFLIVGDHEDVRRLLRSY